MIRTAVMFILLLAIAAPAAAQPTITYGVFTNHGETVAWTLPWDTSNNTDPGTRTGVTVGMDVAVRAWSSLATFVATDGAIGVGPRIAPVTYRRVTAFVDAMIVNLHYNAYAARTWSLETGGGVDVRITDRAGLRYHWTRAYLDGDANRSFSTVSIFVRFE